MSIKLFLHIGTGKTGSTSIQKYLRSARHNLEKNQYYYWGLNLEHAPTKARRTWQRPNGITIIQKMPTKQAIDEITQAVSEALSNTPRDSSIIWSNESICEMSTLFHPAISSILEREEVSLSIICYVREFVDYIVSAYKQWGIKHKTNKGRIMSFDDWVTSNQKFLSYPSHVELYDKAFPSCLNLFNYDNIDDVVSHFLKICHLPLDVMTTESRKQNTSPKDHSLLVYALCNDLFDEPMLPEMAARLLSSRNKMRNLELDPIDIDSIFPSSHDIKRHSEFSSAQISIINQILARHGEPLFTNPSKCQSTTRPDPNSLIFGTMSVLIALLLEQEQRLAFLENQHSHCKPS